MAFSCEICTFSNNDKSKFRKHMLSNAHKQRCLDKNACHKCLQVFSRKSSLGNHAKACSKDLCPITRKSPTVTTVNVKPVTFVSTFNDALIDKNRYHKRIVKQMISKGEDIMDMIPTFDKFIRCILKKRNDRHAEYHKIRDDDSEEDKEYKRRNLEFITKQPLDDYDVCSAIHDVLLRKYKLNSYGLSVNSEFYNNISICHNSIDVNGNYCNHFIKFANEFHNLDKILLLVNNSETYKEGIFVLTPDFDPINHIKEHYPDYYQYLLELSYRNDDNYNNIVAQQTKKMRSGR